MALIVRLETLQRLTLASGDLTSYLQLSEVDPGIKGPYLISPMVRSDTSKTQKGQSRKETFELRGGGVGRRSRKQQSRSNIWYSQTSNSPGINSGMKEPSTLVPRKRTSILRGGGVGRKSTLRWPRWMHWAAGKRGSGRCRCWKRWAWQTAARAWAA